MADVGSINKVILLGYLGKDPELQRDLNSNSSFCVLQVATKEYYRTRDGKEQKPTTWHRCVAWGKPAEIIARYGRAGTLVALEGKIKRKQWEYEGAKRQRVEISVDNLTIVGGKLKHPVGEEPPEENPEEDELISPEEQEEKRGDDPY